MAHSPLLMLIALLLCCAAATAEESVSTISLECQVAGLAYQAAPSCTCVHKLPVCPDGCQVCASLALSLSTRSLHSSRSVMPANFSALPSELPFPLSTVAAQQPLEDCLHRAPFAI
jgi:hypothetical protein